MLGWKTTPRTYRARARLLIIIVKIIYVDMTAPYLKFTNFKIPNKLWRCVGGRVKDEDFIGFIKRANKGQISTVKDLES